MIDRDLNTNRIGYSRIKSHSALNSCIFFVRFLFHCFQSPFNVCQLKQVAWITKGWDYTLIPFLVLCCRLEAMQALGLYCLLEGIPRPEGQVAALRAGLVWQRPQTGSDAEAEAEEAAIRIVAAKALCDWALIK